MQLNDPDDWIRFHLCRSPLLDGVKRLGVAVSGGGDSMAVLHAYAADAADMGVVLEAATVDHGLRPEAAEEARFVAETCERLGIPHATLQWLDWDGRGNLQAEARRARYRLLADWARTRDLDAVGLAHTLDDQAETFLMRLGREAGVEGLSAMDASFMRDGVRFIRPALPLSREDLRGYLSRRGYDWREDPSNEDEAYDRVRARKALAALAPLGIHARGLRAVAENLSSASEALRLCALDTAGRIARQEAGDVVFDRAALLRTPFEITRRLLVSALAWVSGADYAPRRDAVGELVSAIARGRTHTLYGCLVSVDEDHVHVGREYNAIAGHVVPFGALWDGRWHVEGPGEGCEIRALGEAVKDCPDWRETGLPRTSLMASPAVWRGETLVAAPVAGFAAGFSATIDHPAGDFFTSVLSH